MRHMMEGIPLLQPPVAINACNVHRNLVMVQIPGRLNISTIQSEYQDDATSQQNLVTKEGQKFAD